MFFPSEVPEFLHVLFNLVAKCFRILFAEMLLFRFVVFIVHTSIFCPRFSQKKVQTSQKNTEECFTT